MNARRQWKTKNSWSRNRQLKVVVASFTALVVLLTSGMVFMLLKIQDSDQRLSETESRLNALGSDIEQKNAQYEAEKRLAEELAAALEDAKTEIAAYENAEDSPKYAEALDRIGALEEQLKKAGEERAALEKELSEYQDILNSSKLVSLTFDDGPGPYTERLLDELKKRNIKATFFVLGIQVKKYPATVKRIVAEGHEIACHSWDHKNLTTLNAAKINEQMQKTVNAVKEATGGKGVIKLMRPPGGQFDAKVQADSKKRGWKILKWSVDTRDWEKRNVDTILKTAFQKDMFGRHDGAVILMHDIYKTTVDASVKMMDRLAEQGYSMVTASVLLDVRIGGGEAGEMYKSAAKI